MIKMGEVTLGFIISSKVLYSTDPKIGTLPLKKWHELLAFLLRIASIIVCGIPL